MNSFLKLLNRFFPYNPIYNRYCEKIQDELDVDYFQRFIKYKLYDLCYAEEKGPTIFNEINSENIKECVEYVRDQGHSIAELYDLYNLPY